MKQICSLRNQKALQNKGNLLVGYLPQAYPDGETFVTLLPLCQKAGMDILEIGYPASNPTADGQVIRQAHQMIDKAHATDLEYWQKIRQSTSCPIWVMGYAQDLVETGAYLALAKAGVMDALVVPDLPCLDCERIADELAEYQVDVVAFSRPDMGLDEMDFCFTNFALVYQQLYAGQTGGSEVDPRYKELLKIAKKFDGTFVFAGFGINTPQRVREIFSDGFDGAIVGTAMVKKLNESQQDLIEFIEQIQAFAKE